MPRVLYLLLFLALLAPVPSPSAASDRLSAEDREHYKNAFLHFGKRNYRDARLHAARASNPLPAKVIRWLVLTREESEVSFKETVAFFTENPDWPRRRALQQTIERSMPDDLPDRKILAWYDAHPPVSVAGVMHLAGALRRAGRLKVIHDLIRQTWREGDFNREQEQIYRALYRKILTREDHVARLDRLLWNRESRAARRLARRIGRGYPELAEARLALAARKPGVDYSIRQVPKHLLDDPGLLYERARWRQRKGRFRDVVALLDPPQPDLPRPERWWRLKEWAVRGAIDRGEYKLAYRLASHHGLSEGVGFAEGEWLAGWIALRFVKQPKQAYRHFERLYEGVTSPISRARGAYWAGRAAVAMDKQDWARRWYRTAAEYGAAFYGQVAATTLDQPITVNLESVAPAPSAKERERFQQQELVRVIRILGQLRQPEYQELFLHHLRTTAETPADYLLVAELAADQRREDIAVRTAKTARNKGIILPEQLYPYPTLPFAGDPEAALVLAVIRQESAFRKDAVSHAGARGLMQLIPSTAKLMARSLGLGYSRSKLTRDPSYNLRLGQAYLSRQLDRYDGSHVIALAAYNAGPGRADSWIRKLGDPRSPKVDTIDWIERIPFSETRNYVMRVLESLVVYRDRLDAPRIELPLGPATASLTNM